MIGRQESRPASVTVLVGISGSGKSTYARRTFPPVQILSTDELRIAIADSPAAADADTVTEAVLLTMLDERCRRGLPTVVDSTGLSPRFRSAIRNVAALRSADVHLVAIEADVEQCSRRNRHRTPERRVPDAVLRRQQAAYLEAMTSVADEGYSSIRVERLHRGNDGSKIFLSLPVSENFTSKGAFRPERRAFYESVVTSLHAIGAAIESAVLNEDWGAIKLETIDFTTYDLAAIDRSDALVVVTNTRLGSDIYLEVGYAAAQSKPVLMVVPWGTRLTYMLEGLRQLGGLTVIRFDAEEDVEQLIMKEGERWLTTAKGVRNGQGSGDRFGQGTR